MFLLTASGSRFASQLLPLPFFRLLILGLTASPPGELEHLPNAPKAGWKGGSVAGSSSISRTSRNVLPGEPPWLPPSFFIHENSISLGAGCQRQPLKRGVQWPPFPRTGPRPSGQQRAVPGQFLTRVQGRWPHSACVHTPAGVPRRQPQLAQAGLVALATHPRARAHQTPNLTPTRSDVCPPTARGRAE